LVLASSFLTFFILKAQMFFPQVFFFYSLLVLLFSNCSLIALFLFYSSLTIFLSTIFKIRGNTIAMKANQDDTLPDTNDSDDSEIIWTFPGYKVTVELSTFGLVLVFLALFYRLWRVTQG
jgi:hypothetical protein